MDPKQNGNEPAQPVVFTEDNGYGLIMANVSYGLTKREYFAATAPPVHPSFNWEDPQFAVITKASTERIKAATPEDEVQRKICESWHRDPCYDLDENDPEQKAYSDAVHASNKELSKFNALYPARQRAAWAVAYADALLAELAKVQP